MTINSRQKGAAGERELAKFLKDRGLIARRGQQFSGGPGSPDVVTESYELRDVHLECKRVEAGNPYKWLEQAIRDADGKIPVVAHRKSRQDWIAILPLDDLIRILKERI